MSLISCKWKRNPFQLLSLKARPIFLSIPAHASHLQPTLSSALSAPCTALFLKNKQALWTHLVLYISFCPGLDMCPLHVPRCSHSQHKPSSLWNVNHKAQLTWNSSDLLPWGRALYWWLSPSIHTRHKSTCLEKQLSPLHSRFEQTSVTWICAQMEASRPPDLSSSVCIKLLSSRVSELPIFPATYG